MSCTDISSNPLHKGGKYIGEGADGCIFSAPYNWPCESPLQGYSPHDKSLVSKIVGKNDIEGNILEIIKKISYDNQPRYNLIKYVGQCVPRIKNFKNTQKNGYAKHLKQLNTTKKACKIFATNLLKQSITQKNNPYKQYIIGKYEMTYKDFTKILRERESLKNDIANIVYTAHFSLIDTLELLINHPKYSVINYDLHSKNLVIFKNPSVTTKFNITDAKTFQIGAADFGRALYKIRKNKYSFSTFTTWDLPYLEAFFMKDEASDKDKQFSSFNHFSFEARLINFIVTYIERGESKEQTWIERMANNNYVKIAMNDKDSYDIFLMYLLTLIDEIKTNKKPHKLYKEYESKIVKLVRALRNKSLKEQYTFLKSNPEQRDFLDSLKAQSHLPSALGVVFIHSLRACRYSRDEIKSIIQNPSQTAIYVPEKLRLLLFKYINCLTRPFTDKQLKSQSSL